MTNIIKKFELIIPPKDLEKAINLKESPSYNTFTQYREFLSFVNTKIDIYKTDRRKLVLALKENERKRKLSIELLRELTK